MAKQPEPSQLIEAIAHIKKTYREAGVVLTEQELNLMILSMEEGQRKRKLRITTPIRHSVKTVDAG